MNKCTRLVFIAPIGLLRKVKKEQGREMTVMFPNRELETSYNNEI